MRQSSLSQADLDQAVDMWMRELQGYSFSQLTAKPSPSSWSVGQIYIHLISATHYFIKQIHSCTSHNENSDKDADPPAKSMFDNNDFPDQLIDGPPSNAVTRQPESKDQIIAGLIKLKEGLKKAAELAQQNQFTGKTKHFGLGFFTAAEWLQFAEMHMRHHLRQKKRLDAFLKLNDIH
jgi:DinB family protein